MLATNIKKIYYINKLNDTCNKWEISSRTEITCSGLASSPTFNLANERRISSNFVLACSKSKSLSNLIVVFGRPLLFWVFKFWRNDCYRCVRKQQINFIPQQQHENKRNWENWYTYRMKTWTPLWPLIVVVIVAAILIVVTNPITATVLVITLLILIITLLIL